MADKFHFNPETGKTGECDANVRGCKFKLSADEHYPTAEAAAQAYQKSMKGYLIPESPKKRSKSDKPKNYRETAIDTEIEDAFFKLAQAEDIVASYMKMVGRGAYQPDDKRVAIAYEVRDKCQAAAEEAEAKYTGWNRYVAVPGGHVHYADCSTLDTYKTSAMRGLAPEVSGLSADEVVDRAGERACTVCFPNAPVDSRERPSMMQADVDAREKAQQKRTAAEEKLEKKRLGSLNDKMEPIYFDGTKCVSIRSLEMAIGDSLFYTLRAEATHPSVTDADTIKWHKDKAAEHLESIESVRELLVDRHRELGKDYDFDAMLEKYHKKFKKSYVAEGWSFDD